MWQKGKSDLCEDLTRHCWLDMEETMNQEMWADSRHKNDSQLTANKVMETAIYNCMELNSASNLYEPGSGFSSRVSR